MEPNSTTIVPPPIPSSGPPPLPTKKVNLFRRIISALGKFFDYLFGLMVILLSLAALSAIPVLHFFSLGYLLEASGRIAKSGRIRDGFIGLNAAARIGKIIVAGWIIFLPIRLIHSYWIDSQIIDPGSETGTGLKIALIIVTTLAIFAISWAIIRGGKFRHFIWMAPIRLIRWMGEPKSFDGLKKKFSEVKNSLKLLDYFKLGFFGFVGGALWLAIPVGILFLATQLSNQPLSLLTSLLGGILLGIVTLYVPFLQTRYAVSRKFSEFGDWRGVRASFRRAPLALWIALFVTLLFSLPLYLLKIELAPQEVAWIPNLVFVVFMFPARLLLGWANSRSVRREQNRHWTLRIMGRLGMLPAVIVYVFIVWLTQYLSWHGSYSLLEQHAFLLPAPMLGL